MSKNAIVFGASSGIGKELSKLLAKDGYQVLITGRRIELLQDLKAEFPDQFYVRQHDITDLPDTERLFEELPKVFETTDLIVHNAGIGQNNFNLEWEKELPTLETNIMGAAKVYQLGYSYFRDQGYGHLVGITSVASLVGNRHVPAYHASKAFQTNYLGSLWMKAKKTKKAKITITDIRPGFVDTDIITGPTFWMASLEKAVDQIYSAIKEKKRKAYITKRWRLVALMIKIVPPQILMKFL